MLSKIKILTESYRDILEDRILNLIEDDPKSWKIGRVLNDVIAIHSTSGITIINPFSNWSLEVKVWKDEDPKETKMSWRGKRRIVSALKDLYSKQVLNEGEINTLDYSS